MQSKNRGKLFIENFLVYGLGGTISRFIPMIMLPIITRLYPNSEYVGLNDLSTTFISFAAALALCGMYDAMFRLFFDDKKLDFQKQICSTALIFVTCTTLMLGIIFLVFRKEVAAWYFGSEDCEILVIITILGFMVNSTNQIVSAPTRIQNKRKVFLVTNTLSPVISYSIAIPLILKGYYLVAIPLATIVSGVTLEISFGILNKTYFSIKSFRWEKVKDLLKIGLPLMPNFIVYWIYNSADKVMISQILGNSYTGVYSVASKIGHISNLIYTAFAGGWLYFSYSTMNDDDQVQLKSDIFEYLGVISFFCTIALAAVSRLGFKLLFTEEYIEGYLVAPYLFLAPLLLMLYQVIANQFTIIKKTYMNLLALSSGAILNVIFNFVMVPVIGIEGASIATVLGYVISLVMCVCLLKKMKLININAKVKYNVIIFVSYFVIWRVFLHKSSVLSILVALFIECFYLLLYKDKLLEIISKKRK